MKILKEPLLHFLVIGGALFALFAVTSRGDSNPPQDQIVVSEGRVEQLANVFTKTWQRPPTREDLERVVNDFVLEEAYYRKAIESGLDRDDTIIRRRLKQKLEFISDSTAAFLDPSDEQLARYLHDHADQFRLGESYTFRQIYFNPEKHGNDPVEFCKQELERLRDGANDVGDSTLVQPAFEDASRRFLDGRFGNGFSSKLDQMRIGEWDGPIESGLGLHLVFVDSVEKGRLPELSEVRSAVHREWSNDQRIALRHEMDQELLSRHEIIIEWPSRFQNNPVGAGKAQ